MEKKIVVFEVRHEMIRCVKEKTEKIIFEFIDGVWIYHAPNAQNHTEEQLEIILSKLKELNTRR